MYLCTCYMYDNRLNDILYALVAACCHATPPLIVCNQIINIPQVMRVLLGRENVATYEHKNTEQVT
jgi:hypothetical protein